MAISTMDGLVSSLGSSQKVFYTKSGVGATVAGQMYSLLGGFGIPGPPSAGGAQNEVGPNPGGATVNTSSTAGTIPLSTHVGAIPFTNPVSPALTYLAGLRGYSTVVGTLVVYDMLWSWTSTPATTTSWNGATQSTAQSTSSPVALTRPDSLGNNTELWLEAYTASGSITAGTSTVTYTNSAGTASRSASTSIPAGISPIGAVYRYQLAAGDTGVRSVQSIVASSAAGGLGTNNGSVNVWRLMIVRRIAEIPVPQGGFLYNAIDLGMPRIYDSAFLGVSIVTTSTVASTTQVSLQLAQG